MKTVRLFMFRCLRKLHMQSWCYYIFSPFVYFSKHVKAEDLADAYRRLRALHPDSGHSCLCRNELESFPCYDLQIVIPAYNVEQYIEECIDSVLVQCSDYRVLIVVVNDGSTDSTWNLLEKYGKYPNVMLINQENKGFSGARNAGLRQIMAQYVMFLDADDRLEAGAVSALMEAAMRTDADIVEGGYRHFVGRKVLSAFCHQSSVTKDWTVLYGFPFGKVYKAWLFESVHFPEGYWFEDTVCIYALYPRCSKVATINDVVYLYRQNEKGISVTSRGNIKTIDALWVTRSMLSDSSRLGISADSLLYESFLSDLSVNYTRFVTLDDRIHQDVFLVSADLYHRFFEGFHTASKRFSFLEKALRHYDYGMYRLYGECEMGV